MSEIFLKYNIEFEKNSNQLKLINPDDEKYTDLMYFLESVEFEENVYDVIIPEVEKSLSGEIVLDSCCAGTVCASFEKETTTLEWQKRVTELPTKDFKVILLEYAYLYFK